MNNFDRGCRLGCINSGMNMEVSSKLHSQYQNFRQTRVYGEGYRIDIVQKEATSMEFNRRDKSFNKMKENFCFDTTGEAL